MSEHELTNKERYVTLWC